jgi:hypothetical protein
MPCGTAFARSSVPSSRSAVRCWLIATRAIAAFMPRMLGRASAPSVKPVCPNDRFRRKNSATSISTGHGRWLTTSPPLLTDWRSRS